MDEKERLQNLGEQDKAIEYIKMAIGTLYDKRSVPYVNSAVEEKIETIIADLNKAIACLLPSDE